jgi:hypothetical protein
MTRRRAGNTIRYHIIPKRRLIPHIVAWCWRLDGGKWKWSWSHDLISTNVKPQTKNSNCNQIKYDWTRFFFHKKNGDSLFVMVIADSLQVACFAWVVHPKRKIGVQHLAWQDHGFEKNRLEFQCWQTLQRLQSLWLEMQMLGQLHSRIDPQPVHPALY